MPRLPRKVKVHVRKCHACHAKCAATSRNPAGPASTASRLPPNQPSAVSATPATQSEGPCHQVPRLPRKVHPKRSMSVSATPATQSVRRPVTQPSRTPARHAKSSRKRQPSAVSATPATQSDSPCHQVPRLPRKVKVHVRKCHACHAKCAATSRNPAGPQRVTKCQACHPVP